MIWNWQFAAISILATVNSWFTDPTVNEGIPVSLIVSVPEAMLLLGLLDDLQNCNTMLRNNLIFIYTPHTSWGSRGDMRHSYPSLSILVRLAIDE